MEAFGCLFSQQMLVGTILGCQIPVMLQGEIRLSFLLWYHLNLKAAFYPVEQSS